MRSETSARWGVLLLMALATWLLWRVIEPFATAFFLAAILAGALQPLHARLSRRFGDRPTVSATIFTLVVIMVLVLPTTGIAAFVVNELSQGIEFIIETARSEGATALLEYLPEPLRKLVVRLMADFPQIRDTVRGLVSRQAATTGVAAGSAVGGMVAATGSMLFQLVMMLIAFFFLLRDGGGLVAWLEENSPLRRGQTHALLLEFRKVSVSVLTSTIATAGVQAAAALAGYLIAGVPYPVFFAVVTFFVAFIPSVGGGSVCVAAAVLILITGHPWAALFLALWGLIVVGLSDNIIKPYLLKHGMNLHGAVVFFALLGGLAFMGPIGLLAGPLIVAFFLSLTRLWRMESGWDPGSPALGHDASKPPQPAR